MLDSEGRTNEVMRSKAPHVFAAFDVLWLNGENFRELPLGERKKRLKRLVGKKSKRVLYVDHIEEHGKALFAEACKRDLEGIVAKPKNQSLSEHPGTITLDQDPKPEVLSEGGAGGSVQQTVAIERMDVTARLISVGISSSMMVGISVLSLTPDVSDPGEPVEWLVHFTPRLIQKLLHVCAYAALTVSWCWTLAGLNGPRARHWYAVGIAAGFGASLEWLQVNVPGRFPSAFDAVVNGLGALAGIAGYRTILRIFP